MILHIYIYTYTYILSTTTMYIWYYTYTHVLSTTTIYICDTTHICIYILLFTTVTCMWYYTHICFKTYSCTQDRGRIIYYYDNTHHDLQTTWYIFMFSTTIYIFFTYIPVYTHTNHIQHYDIILSSEYGRVSIQIPTIYYTLRRICNT